MPTNPGEEDPNPNNDAIVECKYLNPCCYRIEPAARMALITEFVISILGIGGCITGAALQHKDKESELGRETQEARMALMWSFCIPIGLFILCIGASAIVLCHRTFWACVLWIITKSVLLIVVAIVFSYVHRETIEYNAAVARVVGSNHDAVYENNKRRIRRVLLPSFIVVGVVLFLFGAWFIWVIGAYAKHIRDNYLLPRNVVTILDHDQDRRKQGEDHALDAWEEEIQRSRHEFITPGPLSLFLG